MIGNGHVIQGTMVSTRSLIPRSLLGTMWRAEEIGAQYRVLDVGNDEDPRERFA